MRKPETTTLAKLAVAYSGLVWGLFWMPLRGLNHAGLSSLWSLMVFAGVPAVLALPVLAWRWRSFLADWRVLTLIGVTTAAPLALYGLALLETGVIRAMMLFYLTPVWATLLERVVLGQPITAARAIGIVIAFAGMVVIFGTGGGLPLPRSGGDWAALAAGFGWAAATVVLRVKAGRAALDTMAQNLLWTTIVMIPLLALFGRADWPGLALIAAQMWWLVPVIIAVVMTGVFTAMWGAPRLSPGIVGILYMTEISAGTVTAALFSGEPFGLRELAGVALITVAGIFETAVEALGWRPAR
jgi:drug/metabolite transporter (DMT)-like permease